MKSFHSKEKFEREDLSTSHVVSSVMADPGPSATIPATTSPKWEQCHLPGDHDYENRIASWVATQQPDQTNEVAVICPCGCGSDSLNHTSAYYTEPIQQSYQDYTVDNANHVENSLTTAYCLPQHAAAAGAFHTPNNSPLYSPSSPDHYVPQSEYSNPMYLQSQPVPSYVAPAQVTPPPTPPEEDGDKFKCLYMLVDAAISQWEKQNGSPPPQDSIDSTRTYLSL